MLKILLKLKEKELKTLETDKAEITIGRNENNDVHIDNLGVSKKHARIVKQNGAYIIEDLKSTNGTLVNNERVTTARLADSDVVTVGKHTLYISLQDGRNATREFAEATIRVRPKSLQNRQ
jgi:pSer/pThr/pTyr-binding forkhead associated (FHA) protein